MKKYLLIALTITILFSVHPVSAQPGPPAPAPPTVYYIDDLTFKKIVNNQFINIITGQTKNTIGNFGSIDFKDASATLNASKITKNSNVFSINVNAAVNDGFSSIFTNSKLNSDVSAQFRFSLLNPQKRTITYIQSSIIKRDAEIIRIRASSNAEKNLLQTKQSFINAQILKLHADAVSLGVQAMASPADVSIAAQAAHNKYVIDSLKYIKARDLNDINAATQAITEKEAALVKKAKLEIPEITGFAFGWINFVYKATSQSFRLFDGTAAYNDQVKKDNYISHRAGIEYNYYKWSSHAGESWFFSLGGALEVANNLAGLTKIELNDLTNYSSTPGQRTSSKKYNVYAGNYVKGLIGGKFYADYYKFIFDNNMAAIHLYPQIQLQKSEKPIYSAGIGFMVAFKDQKDEKGKNILNAEVYANFLDLTNVRSAENRLLERNDIGIRFVFPIKFFY